MMKNWLKYGLLVLLCFGVLDSQGQGKKLAKKATSKSTWKRIAKLLGKNGTQELDDYVIPVGTEIIGTEPSWTLEDNSTKYPFNLLTTLVVGEYDINPYTGQSRYLPSLKAHRKKLKDADGNDTNIAQIAKATNPNIKALIALSFYNDFGQNGKDHYRYLFSKERYKKIATGLNNEFGLLKEVGYVEGEFGIMIDFEGWENVRDAEKVFPKFLEELYGALDNGTIVYFKLPPKTYTRSVRPNLVRAIKETGLIDYFVIKGYGFEHESIEMSAVSPVKYEGIGLENTIQHYAKVLDKSEIILESPFYGTVWERSNMRYTPNAKQFLMPYNKIAEDIIGRESYRTNIERDSARYAYYESDEKRYVFENDTILNRTYQWAKADSLGGVGIMALGYADTKEQEVWWRIAQNFGTIPQPIGWTIAGFLSLFMFCGFFFSVVHYWEVRNILAVYRKYLVNIGGFALLTLLIFLLCMNIIPRGFVGMMILGGIMLFFFLYKAYRRYMAKFKKIASYAK